MFASFGAFFLIAALAVGWITDRQARSYARVEHDGVATDATVIRFWIGGGRSRDRMVSYRFVAESTEIIGESSLSTIAWDALHSGGSLSIRYVPLAPELNHPAQGAPPPAPVWLVAAVILWPTAVFWTIVYRQRRLLAAGAPARATVTRIEREIFGRGGRGKKFRVVCSFTPAGRQAMTATFYRRAAPAPGTEVCLLCDPDNPRRNAVYPLELVRVRLE